MPPVGFEPKISEGERPQAAHLLRSWVRIPPGAWIFVCCECRVLSGTGLCDELITRPGECYRVCCVVVCDLETSRMGAPYIYYISHLRVKCSGIPKYKVNKIAQLYRSLSRINTIQALGTFLCNSDSIRSFHPQLTLLGGLFVFGFLNQHCACISCSLQARYITRTQ